MNNLRGKQLKFVEHFSQGKTGAESARLAGYAPTNAAQTASHLLKTPAIAEALEKVRNSSQEVASYNLEAAMREAHECIAFAEATKNANARVKAVELKAKLSGHLAERHEIRRPEGFTINISGIGKANDAIDVSVEPTLIEENKDSSEDDQSND